MDLRCFILLLIISAGNLQFSYAAIEGSFQDSVKNVYIRVRAEEKPKAVSIDSVPQTKAIAGSTRIYTKKKYNTPTSNIPNKQVSSTTSRKAVEASWSTAKSNDNATTIIIKKNAKAEVQPSSNVNSQLDGQHKDLEEEISQAQIIDDTTVSQTSNSKASKTYLWVGIVLVVVGIILGILFGKTALLVSIAGLIFVIIGYTIKS